jgi:anti-sigma B factor antagonist
MMNPKLHVLQSSGIFDSTIATSFHQEIDQALGMGIKVIVVDFQATTFIDSSGLGVLVSAQKRVGSQGGHLLFCGLNPQVKMIFELTSLDQAFAVFDNLEAVEKSLVN